LKVEEPFGGLSIDSNNAKASKWNMYIAFVEMQVVDKLKEVPTRQGVG